MVPIALRTPSSYEVGQFQWLTLIVIKRKNPHLSDTLSHNRGLLLNHTDKATSILPPTINTTEAHRSVVAFFKACATSFE